MNFLLHPTRFRLFYFDLHKKPKKIEVTDFFNFLDAKVPPNLILNEIKLIFMEITKSIVKVESIY